MSKKPSSTRAPPSQYQRARRSAAPANFVVHEPELTLILPIDAPAAMADTDFMLGSFGMGAQPHDRESVSVRVALEIPRPERFVIGKWIELTP
ncbi:hypothetical protein GCM10020295_00020 [Streptomyces cinereospinus]